MRFGRVTLVTVTCQLPIALGLDNHGFRYFDPEVGRYITRDPIGYGDGLNVYLYVHNNPINHIDPLGLVTIDTTQSEDDIQKQIDTDLGKDTDDDPRTSSDINRVIASNPEGGRYLKTAKYYKQVGSSLAWRHDNWQESGFAVNAGGEPVRVLRADNPVKEKDDAQFKSGMEQARGKSIAYQNALADLKSAKAKGAAHKIASLEKTLADIDLQLQVQVMSGVSAGVIRRGGGKLNAFGWIPFISYYHSHPPCSESNPSGIPGDLDVNQRMTDRSNGNRLPNAVPAVPRDTTWSALGVPNPYRESSLVFFNDAGETLRGQINIRY